MLGTNTLAYESHS